MLYCSRHQRACYPGGLTRRVHGAQLQRVPPHWYALLPYAYRWAQRMAVAFPSGVQIKEHACDVCAGHQTSSAPLDGCINLQEVEEAWKPSPL